MDDDDVIGDDEADGSRNENGESWLAEQARLRRGGACGRHLDVNGQIIALQRRGDVFQQGAQRQAGRGPQHRLFRIGQAGDDGAAAFRLLSAHL